MRWKNRWFWWCLNDGWMGISMVNDGWMGISMGILWCWIMLNYVEFQLNVTSQISNLASEFDLFKGNGKVIPYVSSLSIFAIQSLFVGVIRVIPISCSSMWISDDFGPARQLNILYRGLELLKVGGRLVRALGCHNLPLDEDQRDSWRYFSSDFLKPSRNWK